MVLKHMHKKFEIRRTKIKGGCQSGRKVVTHDSKSDLLLDPDILPNLYADVYRFFDPASLNPVIIKELWVHNGSLEIDRCDAKRIE